MHKRIRLAHFPRHRVAPLLFLLVLLTLLTGCGTSQGAVPTRSTTTPTLSPTATPVLVTQPVSFVTSVGITLMGSSLGGLISLKEAAAEHFDALVPISAPVAFEDVQLSDAELQRITTPKLFVTSDQNDPFTSDTYHMFDVTPQPKEERVYPGRRHGLALFQGTSGPDLLSALRQFLQRYAPVN